MSRTVLFAKSSMTARTQGEASERHRPGKGEVSSTWTCSSHHCQGGGGQPVSFVVSALCFSFMFCSVRWLVVSVFRK